MVFFRVQITEDEIQQITGRGESVQPRGLIYGYLNEIQLKTVLNPRNGNSVECSSARSSKKEQGEFKVTGQFHVNRVKYRRNLVFCFL